MVRCGTAKSMSSVYKNLYFFGEFALSHSGLRRINILYLLLRNTMTPGQTRCFQTTVRDCTLRFSLAARIIFISIRLTTTLCSTRSLKHTTNAVQAAVRVESFMRAIQICESSNEVRAGHQPFTTTRISSTSG